MFQLEKMKKLTGNRLRDFTYELYNVSFPEGKEADWISEFRPCATARLFLPVSYKNKITHLHYWNAVFKEQDPPE